MHNRASILVGLLWCVALLGLVVVSVLHTATMDLKVGKNFGDKIQARYLALAGVEKARALLYEAARMRGQSGVSPDTRLFDAPDQFREIKFGRGEFSVMHRQSEDEGGTLVYGVSDEESRLNINTASSDELVKINGLTVDIASAILAWRGQSTDTNAAGANVDYYAALRPPYQPRNGPFQTIRELLMVRGVTPELLFGEDFHQNGMLPEPNDSEEDSAGSGNLSSLGDAGWAAMLTVDSSVGNLNVSGARRVNVQTAGEADLAAINGITPTIARAIVQYRGQHQFKSIGDLLDVTAAQNQNGGGGNARNNPPQNDPLASTSTNSNQIVDETLLTQIADDITIDTAADQPGLINLNTAGLETLLCLPGMDRERAQAIISYAKSQGSFANIAQLLKVQGVDRDLFKQIAPLVTARSETYRILSEGRIKSTGTSQRIQMIVRINRTEITTLSYREDNL